MNPLLRILAVGALLTATQSFAAGFEGKVSLAITAEKGKSQALDYSMKEQKLRIDMSADGHSFSSIMDLVKMETLMLMPEQKMYMVMSIKKPVEKAMEKQTTDNTEVEVTGKTDTILGYKANQILIKDKERGTVTEMWAAEGLGTFMGMGQSGGGGGMFGGKKSANAAKWEEALKGKGGFPLRVITHDAKGKENFKMEATKIEPGKLPDSLFLPPPGYEKMDMGNMMMPGLGGLNPFKRG
jgi:Domain of unknown function (DUF4412)